MVDASSALTRGRECYAAHAWLDAFESLAIADDAAPLGPDDLELLARAAYMLGRDDDYVSGLERAHHAHVDGGEVTRAVRCAFWIGHNLIFRGHGARGSGWFVVGERLLQVAGDCVERGYLLIPVWLKQMGGGDWESGFATAVEAAAIGERFGDADLMWLARDDQSRSLVKQGRIDEGLRALDEVLVVVSSGALSPIVSGIVYCNTIIFCRDVYEFRHVSEWTDALTLWCDRQPQMVAHNGLCLVHQAEVMQLRGMWSEALDEARSAGERFTAGVLNQRACGHAHYRQGEIHRLQGRLGAAEESYRAANRFGHEPQPGLALLRLAQGNSAAAASAIRRAVSETVQGLKRAALLPAYVEIMLADGDVDAARTACGRFDDIVAEHGNDALEAMSAHARASVALAEGDAEAALVAARRAWRGWHDLEAPYEAARARVLVATACRSLGDNDSASLELEAARELFVRVGAGPDIAWVDSVTGRGGVAASHGLSARELEVLRLVGSGKSNREIAAALVISEHTVARHLQNIFAKLGVSSRTAASAFAFEHDLV